MFSVCDSPGRLPQQHWFQLWLYRYIFVSSCLDYFMIIFHICLLLVIVSNIILKNYCSFVISNKSVNLVNISLSVFSFLSPSRRSLRKINDVYVLMIKDISNHNLLSWDVTDHYSKEQLIGRKKQEKAVQGAIHAIKFQWLAQNDSFPSTSSHLPTLHQIIYSH